MHIPTHIMSGWCVGNLLPFTPRERMLCMVAASILDIDGLGILISQNLYWDYHHKLGHCLLFGVLVSTAMALISTHKIKAGIAYLALFHLHLLLDYLGSGPGWPLYYGWPFSNAGWENKDAWEFFSWQNISAAGLLLAWTIGIAARWGRTPLEVLMPRLDAQLVAIAQRKRIRGSAPSPAQKAEFHASSHAVPFPRHVPVFRLRSAADPQRAPLAHRPWTSPDTPPTSISPPSPGRSGWRLSWRRCAT